MGKLKKVLLLVVALCVMISIMSIAATAGDTPVAQIGDNYYASLADAIAAVPTDGTATTITMIDDSVEAGTITIASTKNIVLDLNGHTVSHTSTLKSVYFITNNGTLEITDLSVGENGKITMAAVPDTGYSVENVTLYNCGGTLTLTKGTIENTTNGGLTYAVNNSSNAWGSSVISTFNMTGGVLSAPNGDATLRVYQNTGVSWKVYSTNHVNISGGTILNDAIFVDTVLYTNGQDVTDFNNNDITKGCVIDTEINITGGTINGLIDMKIRHPFGTSLNISGGDFTNAKLRVRKYAGEYGINLSAGTLSEPTTPMVNISGGKWSFETGKAFGLASDYGASTWTTFKPYKVTGGVFNVDLNAFSGIVFPNGKTGVANTDSATAEAYPYTVGFAVAPVAQIGEATYYTSLADAIAAVPDNTATTITLLHDASLTSSVTIAGSKNIVVDLNNKTLTVNSGSAPRPIRNNGTLTFENGAIENTFTGTYGILDNYGTLYLTNVNVTEAPGDGGATFRNMTGGHTTVNGGTYTSTGASGNQSFRNHANATGSYLEINNATFVSSASKDYPLVIRAGVAVLNGITVNSIGSGAVCVDGGSVTISNSNLSETNASAGVYYAVYVSNSFGPSTVTINGGTYNGGGYDVLVTRPDGDNNGSEQNGNVSVTINAGAFTNNGIRMGTTTNAQGYTWSLEARGGTYSVDPTDYVASGYEATDNGDGTWTVGAIKPFAAYNANGDLVGRYLEVDDAITAAGNGGTIKLVADVNKQVSIYERTISPLTFDLNGHWIRVDQGAGINLGATWTFMDQYTTYTFTDTVGNGGIEITPKYFGNACISDNNGRTIIIEGGTYISTGKAIYCTGSDATLTINGGTFTGDIYVHDTGYGHGEVAITGGTVNGTISAIDNAVLTVSGGTFNSDPTAYVASGYEAVNNGNGTWTVDQIKVAQIGTTYYTSLADAIAAATDGDTITLLADVSLTERLFINAGSTPAYAGSGNRYATTTENKSITLNLNGHNITSSSNIALAGGSLNITGAGTITTTASGLAPIEIRGTGNLTSKRTLTIGANVVLNGAQYGLNVFGSNDSNKNVIDVTVNGTVNGTLFVLGNLSSPDNEINIVVNGTIAAPANTNDAIVGIALNGNANVTVNTGATVSGESGIEVRRGELTVHGGTITATAAEYSSTANNSGSTTKGAAIAIYQYGTGLDVTINGGTLNGVKKIAVNGDMSGVNASALQTYTTDNTVIPAGYKWAATSGNMYTLTEVTYVVQIGEVKYETLADAIAAAQSGNTITLLANIDLTATVNIEKSLTIDLNGKSITATNARALWVKSGEVAITGTGTISATKTANGSFASSSSVIRVGNSGTEKAKLTIGTGVTVSTDYCYGVTVFGTNTNGVELVVNGNVTVTGTAAAISGNGNSGNKGNVTINAGAVVTATADAAIYHPQGDTLTINGGSITGPVAVYQKSGTMTINGGTFTATAEAADYTPKGDGLTPTGDVIVIDNCGYPGGAPSASIKNATIANGQKIGYYVNGTSAEGTVRADSAYTLNTNTEKEWVADTSVTGYSYRIATPTYVAQIGTTKYTSLADAITAANVDTTSDSITITLLEDIDFSTEKYAGYKWAGSTYNPLTIKRSNVTIDLNGHTISEMGNAALVFGNLLAKDGRIANITIKNGTLSAGKTDNVTNSYVLGIAGVDGVLVKNVTTMGGINVYTGSKNVVIESCNVAGTKYYTVCAQCGSDVTIKGTTCTKNTDSTVANKSMFWIQGAGTDSDMVTTENQTGAFGTSSITIESGNFTVDISNGGVFYLSTGVKPIVKGGYFNIDPTAYVAQGYSVEAGTYVVNNVTYNFKVVQYVEQSTTNVSTTTTVDNTTTTTTTDLATSSDGTNTQYVIKIETTTTVGSADPATTTTYTPVNVDVTSNNNKGADLEQNIDTTGIKNAEEKKTAIATAKQTVEAVTDQTAEFKAKLDKNEASSANVLKTTAAANAIAKAAAAVNAGQITDAKIELKTTLKSYTLADGTNSSVKATKVVYEIKPVAVLYKVENEVKTQLGNAVELDNADIKEGETFTFTIPVPANMTATTVKVSHIGTNGYSTEIGTYTVQGTGSNRYVTVTVDHFSEFELEEAAVDIDGNCVITASISLKDSIDINFYVKNIAVGTSLSDYEVRYTFNGVETVVPGNEWIPANSGSYKFVVASCAAKQINDNVEFEVLYKGVRIKEVDSYSIRQYCVNKINANSDQKLVEICRAVLDYGAAAQNYFNYNTENLANDGGYGLTSKEESVPNTYNIVSATKASDVTKLSATLSTVSKTEINFYVTTDYMQTVKVTLNDNDVSNIEYGLVEGSNNVYKITVKGIAARNLDNVYVLTVETEAETTTTLTYSALAYTYRKQDSSLSESGLSLAIYNYYLKAKAYFG